MRSAITREYDGEDACEHCDGYAVQFGDADPGDERRVEGPCAECHGTGIHHGWCVRCEDARVEDPSGTLCEACLGDDDRRALEADYRRMVMP